MPEVVIRKRSLPPVKNLAAPLEKVIAESVGVNAKSPPNVALVPIKALVKVTFVVLKVPIVISSAAKITLELDNVLVGSAFKIKFPVL